MKNSPGNEKFQQDMSFMAYQSQVCCFMRQAESWNSLPCAGLQWQSRDRLSHFDLQSKDKQVSLKPAHTIALVFLFFEPAGEAVNVAKISLLSPGHLGIWACYTGLQPRYWVKPAAVFFVDQQKSKSPVDWQS